MYASEVRLLNTFCVLAATISTESPKWKTSFHMFYFLKCEVATRKTGLCYYKTHIVEKNWQQKSKNITQRRKKI